MTADSPAPDYAVDYAATAKRFLETTEGIDFPIQGMREVTRALARRVMELEDENERLQTVLNRHGYKFHGKSLVVELERERSNNLDKPSKTE